LQEKAVRHPQPEMPFSLLPKRGKGGPSQTSNPHAGKRFIVSHEAKILFTPMNGKSWQEAQNPLNESSYA
jgi:hypothetical protein